MVAGITSVRPAALDALVEGLCQQAPWLADALRADVARFLEPRLASGYLSAAFNTSLLAWNGCPLEFTTSTARPQGLAGTFDAQLPQFHCACGDGLRFGHWQGRKYSQQGVSTKIYSEVPAGGDCPAQWTHQGMPYSTAQLAEAGLQLLMVGHYPDQADSPVEFYFQWHSAEITHDDIVAVGALFACDTALPALMPLLAAARAQTQSDGHFPYTTYGFSVVYQQQQLESFTVFTVAPRFFGSNARVPDALNRLLAQQACAMPLLQSLLDKHIPLQFNVLGLSVDRQGRCAISCTFSPQNDRFTEVAINVAPSPPPSTPLGCLLQRQTASGAFPSYVRTPDGRWHRDENAFVTAQVLRTLEYTAETAPYIEKALDFIASCACQPARYRFWPADAHPTWMRGDTLAPDVDDTAIITELLYKFGRISLDEVVNTLATLSAYQIQRVDRRLAEPQCQWAECLAFYSWMKEPNTLAQLDCCVNTNALILLACVSKAQNRVIPASARILTLFDNALAWSENQYDRINQLIPYYAHPNEWLVTLHYAARCGITHLTPLITALEKWRLPASQTEIPLYRRHDGQYLWTSTELNAFRQLALSHPIKDTYEHIPH